MCVLAIGYVCPHAHTGQKKRASDPMEMELVTGHGKSYEEFAVSVLTQVLGIKLQSQERPSGTLKPLRQLPLSQKATHTKQIEIKC